MSKDARSCKGHGIAYHKWNTSILGKSWYEINEAKPLNVREWNKVSLMENWGLKVPYPLEMSPPRLSTLWSTVCGIESIPEGFFVHMQGLTKNPIKGSPKFHSKYYCLPTVDI
ncbi:hypothetical protein V6N11_016717 [Hibiscus sabdariffa]|uniref:Uncharacterized protein n=1 Tax=Hibiscus sabdariffa TaxID=183260 RepID=A0ABR2TVV2_9ROSI